mgnify:CR=1 FL=1|jgi:uncharacterized protein YjiS (DUF1127 family)
MAETTLTSGAANRGIFHKIMCAVRGTVTFYRRQQTLHELSALDDHLFQDIGINRVALAASSKPNCGADRKETFYPRHQIG